MHWTERAFRENAGVFRHHLEDRLADADDEVTDLLALLRDQGIEPATTLDVPCGIGRHSVELAARGVTVHGLDISPSYLDRARELATERGVAEHITFERGDMRELDERTETYDLVLNGWTSFGYYDEATDRAVLRGMYERTATGGATVLELVNREGVLADFAAASVIDDRDAADERAGDDHYVVEHREYDPETARMATERQVFAATDDGLEHEGEMTFDVRLYAPAELAGLCRDVGFENVSLYAGLGGEELTRESTRLTVVAQR